MLQISNVFTKNAKAYKDGYKFIINQGGTSSTKTFSILQLLTILAKKHPLQIDIVGLSVSHLKAGVLSDMPKVMGQLNDDFSTKFAIVDKILKLEQGEIRFISIDKIGKAHGGRRDILYINEANHLAYPIAQQLIMRTRGAVFIDFNPTSMFWAHTEFIQKQPDKAKLIKSTYKDNPFLEQSVIDYIESKEGDNNFWKVYGLGEIGIAEGLVFDNWKIQDFDKNSLTNYRYGIDWGFSKDPFAFIELALEKDKIYICNEIYQTGLLNQSSAPLVKEKLGNNVVICDSSEPKSIDEFRYYGIDARAAKKGKGSVESGVKYLASKEIIIHPDCTNVINEFSNYQWKKDKNGIEMPIPVDAFNHAIDAIRYALENDLPSGDFFVF